MGWGPKGERGNPSVHPTSLSVFYHTYLSVAVVGGVDVEVVDEGACNMVINILYG